MAMLTQHVALLIKEMLEIAIQRLINYSNDSVWSYANASLLGVVDGEEQREGMIRAMVQRLEQVFESKHVPWSGFTPHQVATLSVYHAVFLQKADDRPQNGLIRWCYGLPSYISGDMIESQNTTRLASLCLPGHYDGTASADSGRAIAAAPVTCELCNRGFSGHDTLHRHCRREHVNWAEYRKRVFFNGRKEDPEEIHPALKRSIVQGVHFFHVHSVPGSCNEWSHRAVTEAEPRREEACAVCAVKDWLENRFAVYLFRPHASTTTWHKRLYGDLCSNGMHIEEDEDEEVDGSDKAPVRKDGVLLVDVDGVFCVGAKEKVHLFLDVQRYIKDWPRIPEEELHASSVQHPDEPSMRWLLHTRRIQCVSADEAAQVRNLEKLPRCAGIGDRNASVWCCKTCVEHLCVENPSMPPLALTNGFFGGRYHPLFREASMATRMLASSARLIMRQLFLGRGPVNEVHKGVSGNTMLISQPSASYEQVLPNTRAMNEGLVVLFCKDVTDVSKAQMLMVNREQYKKIMNHRRKVCECFSNIVIDSDEIEKLPENGVPDVICESAQCMPETKRMQTTVHGPGNRIPMFHRSQDDDIDGGASSDDEVPDERSCAEDATVHGPSAERDDECSVAEELNEHEVIIGINDECCPKPLKLFQSWQANMSKLEAAGSKLAQLEMKRQGNREECVEDVTSKVAIEEEVTMEKISMYQNIQI